MYNPIKVYIKLKDSIITAIDSSIFLQDANNWICIDSGYGDRYSHAQGMYLGGPIRDNLGRCNYKYVDGKIIELTEEEKEIIYPPIEPQPTIEETILKEMARLKVEIMQVRGGK